MDDIRFTIAQPADDHIETKGLPKFIQRAGRLAASLRQRLCGLSARRELENLTEAQLLDLGINRSARRERWIDGREAHLLGQYHHRIRSDD
jgi:uncharacterized protein YjiS (DUF1127 family)